jgi:PRC-barrel domain
VSDPQIQVEDIKQWRGLDVIDPEAKKLGRLVEILYDTQTDTPAFALVRTGHVGGRRTTLVPLGGAMVGHDYLRVSVEKGAFKDAPSFDPERELTVEDEADAYDYYGIAYPRSDPSARVLAKH